MKELGRPSLSFDADIKLRAPQNITVNESAEHARNQSYEPKKLEAADLLLPEDE